MSNWNERMQNGLARIAYREQTNKEYREDIKRNKCYTKKDIEPVYDDSYRHIQNMSTQELERKINDFIDRDKADAIWWKEKEPYIMTVWIIVLLCPFIIPMIFRSIYHEK
jgi:hypothetical protein